MIEQRIARAAWLLSNVKHAAMATVNADGTPHNTPYFFMRSDDLREFYWCSSPKSVHSQNALRRGDVYMVLYEANERGGLYVRCARAREAVGAELDKALAVHNRLRRGFGWDELPQNYYTNDSPQRMYVADTQAFWVNYSECDEAGRILEDKRAEVARARLEEELHDSF